MAFWQLYYHVVWSTKYRLPTITPEIEPVLFDFIRAKVFGLGGFVHALNGITDHVYLAVSIPPKISISRFVGQFKGVSSARYNHEVRRAPEKRFYWQESYGIFSVDRKRLPHVVAYVQRQKTHHKVDSLIPILEKDEETEATPDSIAEAESHYVTNYDTWFKMMQTYTPRGM